MAKFHGRVGYGHSAKTSPGVWEDVITEKTYSGDVIRNARSYRPDGENISGKLSVGNSISIVADAYASENFFAMRYVEFGGALWTVVDVETQRPRLILRLGEVYNGPKVAAPVSP